MADPITLAETIMEEAASIGKYVDDMKLFKEDAGKVLQKIESFVPSLKTLTDMKTHREELSQFQRDAPEMQTFIASLSDMLECVKTLNQFICDMQKENPNKLAIKRGKIRRNFEDLGSKIDNLQGSTLVSVLDDVTQEVAKSQGQKSVKILQKQVVKHFRKVSSSSGEGKTYCIVFMAFMHASKGILNLPTSSLHLCSPFQQNC